MVEDPEPEYDLAKLKIDIKELPAGAAGLTKNKNYTCRILGGDYPEDGHWVIYEGETKIDTNVFTVSSPSGTIVKIKYYNKKDGVILERTTNVL